MTPEGKVVNAIRRAVKEAGGECRKVHWTAHVGAPDWFVMINGRNFFIEAKAPGQKPEPHQLREHERMRKHGGCCVYVVDSVEEAKQIIRCAAEGAPLGSLNVES